MLSFNSPSGPCASNETRTHTSLTLLVFETNASTNSAIEAKMSRENLVLWKTRF